MGAEKRHRREYVASYPAGVLAFRMTSSRAGKLNAKISLIRSRNVTSNSASTSGGVNAVTLKSNGGIGFTAEARVVSHGGKAPRSRIVYKSAYTYFQGRFLLVVKPYK